MADDRADIGQVLAFWFGDPVESPPGPQRNRLWFVSNPEQDQAIRERFSGLLESALAGERDHWGDSARGRLALIVLLDQFTRNIYRGSAQAFSGDSLALAAASAGIAAGQDRGLSVAERAFFYLPFEHSETLTEQDRCVGLFEDLCCSVSEPERELAENYLQHAREHREIIRRFGRFPHRNALLQRPMTEAEQEYLDAGGKTFGQKR